MKQTPSHVRSRSLVILLTIVIHLLLLLLLVIPHTPLFINQELAQKLEQLHHKIHQTDPQTPWVTVHPNASNGGAPVILVDDDKSDNRPHSKTPDTKAQNDTSQSPQETKQTIETDVEIPDAPSEPTPEHDMPATIPIPHKKVPPYDPNYVPQSLFRQGETHTADSPKTTQHTARPSVFAKASSDAGAKKQPLTMTQLAHDFDTHMYQEQHNAQTSTLSLSMIGQASSSAKMTERQLKEGRYMEKIANCIVAAWKADAHKCPISAPATIVIHLDLVIESNGSVGNVSVLTSSGIHTVDQFVIGIMRSAGTSLPPLPSFLSTNVYHIRCYLDGIDPRRGPYRLVATRQ